MASKQNLVPYLFLLPALSLLVVFNLIPTFATIRESVFAQSFFSGEQVFVGLQNYRDLFNFSGFWRSMEVTLAFNLVVNPLQVALALGLAVLINQHVPGMIVFRSVFLLPVAVSINVTAIVWGLMLDQNAGLVNGILVALGLPRQPFLLSVDQALWSIIAIVSWKGIPFWTLFFLAGLQNIPHSVIEAAKIDGASTWAIFTRIKLPLLRPVIAFVLVADTITNFTMFAPIFLLTRGGPQQTTNLIMHETYRRGFVYGDLSTSSAMITVMLILVIIIIAVQFALLRPKT